MAKVDTAIAAVGIALLVAAAGGLLYVQEVAAVDEYAFPVTRHALETREADVQGRTVLEWHDVPDNATSATVQLTVSFQGRALVGGDAHVEAVLIAPNGTRQTATSTLSVPPAAQEAQTQAELTVSWGSAPATTRLVAAEKPAPRVAEGPLRLEVTVQSPADAPAAASYAFHVMAEAVVDAYAAQPS